jgi:CubicO group peptidase (beta-lactamase class C family)
MMILHDEGRWRASDPIAKFLPAFADVKVFDGSDASGAPRLVAPTHAPIMLELMTHTAGFTYGNGDSPHDALFKAASPWGAESLQGFCERLASVPLAYQPGTKWLYGVAMDVQGAIIERLSGMSLADFLETRIFAPLGMRDTAFFAPPSMQHRLATLYFANKSKKLVPLERPPMLSDNLSPPRIASGGGGLVSTLDDYARFAQMLLNKGTLEGVRIVSEAAIGEMSTNHLSEALIRGGYGIGAQQIRPGMGHGYNCAVYYDPEAAGLPVGKGSFQWDGAAGTWFWVDPQNDLIFVGMIQRFSQPDIQNPQHLTQRLLAGAIL